MEPEETIEAEGRQQVDSRFRQLVQENHLLKRRTSELNVELKDCHRREKALLDSLSVAQMRVDKLEQIRTVNKHRIRSLETSPERVFPVGATRPSNSSSELTDPRVAELERDVDLLSARLEDTARHNNKKANVWRYIEAERERLAAEAKMAKSDAHVDEVQRELVALRAKHRVVQRDLALANNEFVSMNRAHAEHIREKEKEIESLSRQVKTFRRMGKQDTMDELRQMEPTESDDLHQSVRELRNEVGWLKYLCTSLRQTCDTLKNELEQTRQTEEELLITQTQLHDLQEELASYKRRAAVGEARIDSPNNVTPNILEKYNQKLLRQKTEIRRLRKLLDMARGHYASQDYHFVTGV